MDEDKEFLKAKDYAYRLLSYRSRSTKEIKERLNKKGFSPKIVNKAIVHLSELDYLNDENFARSWIRTKIQLAPIGRSLLRYQLKGKGITGELLDKALSEYTKDFDETDAARKLAVSRKRHYKGLEPLKIRQRLYGYLKRRGFSQEAIMQAIES